MTVTISLKIRKICTSGRKLQRNYISITEVIFYLIPIMLI
nr:MAG TPA: hypothetical protein [Bacteriophage sp.]